MTTRLTAIVSRTRTPESSLEEFASPWVICYFGCVIESGKRPGAGAFTLLEVMLAVILLAAVMTAVYLTWSTGLQGWKAATDAADNLQKTRAILDGTTEMLRAAVYYDQAEAGQDADNLYRFEGVHGTIGDYDADSIRFVTLSSRFCRPYEMERVPLRRVQISLEQDENNKPYLAMFAESALKTEDSEKTPPVKLSEDVIGFRVQYFDADIEEWQEDWVDETGMPAQVEITITYRAADETGSPIVQRIVTAIPARDAAEEQSTRKAQQSRPRVTQTRTRL
ncbi:MAG: hypothetical protein EXS18_03640 [Verrucomicrobiae bacterium]|nr:hypothetical protein [Verrucomicrobiae bacterium]